MILRLENRDYITLEQLREKTRQCLALDSLFAQDLLRAYRDYDLVLWLENLHDSESIHKAHRVYGLIKCVYADDKKLIDDLYWSINLDEFKEIDATKYLELLSVQGTIGADHTPRIINNGDVCMIPNDIDSVDLHMSATFLVIQECDEPMDIRLKYRTDDMTCRTKLCTYDLLQRSTQIVVPMHLQVSMLHANEREVTLNAGALGRIHTDFMRFKLHKMK